MSRIKVLLFEDGPASKKPIKDSIEKISKNKVECLVFEASGTSNDNYEDRLLVELKSQKYSGVELIVCDRDLTGIATFTGLSEVIVSSVAAKLGIPVCLYARGTYDDFFSRKRDWGDGRIVLKDNPKTKEGALEVFVLVLGFIEIKKSFVSLTSDSNLKKIKNPSDLLAKILGHPEFADQITLYGSGDQKMLSELFPASVAINVRGIGKAFIVELKRRMPCLLGYWLYNSILRFPGLILNEVALCSYLDIDPKAFKQKSKIRNLFKKALYDGPFAGPGESLWWRGIADELLAKSGAENGPEYIQKKTGINVENCFCSVDPRKKAGYFCIITRRPVSIENSYGNINWFPRGANLSRVSKKIYEEIAPWFGN